MPDSFTHLHVHTHFSFGIGASSPETLAEAAAKRGFSGLACTDTNGVPPESMALLEGLDVLVLDALRTRPHVTHFSLDEAIEEESEQ